MGRAGVPTLILLGADGRLAAAYGGVEVDDSAPILGAFAAGESPPDVDGDTRELLPG